MTAAAARKPSDDELRDLLISEALDNLPTPNPLAGITIDDAARLIDEPASTVLYQFGRSGDATAEFHRAVYARIVERFRCSIVEATMAEVIDALAAGSPAPDVVAVLCRSLSRDVADDPATRFLLGGVPRSQDSPELQRAIDSVWGEFASNIADVLRLVLAARGLRSHLSSPQMNELVAFALAGGWVHERFIRQPDDEHVVIDGADFCPTGAVLWPTLRRTLEPGLVP